LESNIKQAVCVVGLALILALSSGCGVKKAPPSAPPEKAAPAKEKADVGKSVAPPVEPAKPVPIAPPDQPLQPKPDPRMLAAANLTDQGKTYLDSGKPDQAIEVLERALSVDPANGKIYYYMAEAWMMKKNKKQAMEFNRLAVMYFSEDRQWAAKTAEQQKRIQSMP
jgi:tetratricopeptide (TPR) repeat protein